LGQDNNLRMDKTVTTINGVKLCIIIEEPHVDPYVDPEHRRAG